MLPQLNEIPIKKEYNNWYYLENKPNYLAYCHENGKYGWNSDGVWFTNKNRAILNNKWILADYETVETRLIEYAKSIYKVGQLLDEFLGNNGKQIITKFCEICNLGNLELRLYGGNGNSAMVIYNEGNWAKVLSQPYDKIILDESHIDKCISFNFGNKFYDFCKIIKENDQIYILNNCYSNSNGHSDKNIFKYSLHFTNFTDVNCWIENIKFIEVGQCYWDFYNYLNKPIDKIDQNLYQLQINKEEYSIKYIKQNNSINNYNLKINGN